jgi:hypothetical protein
MIKSPSAFIGVIASPDMRRGAKDYVVDSANCHPLLDVPMILLMLQLHESNHNWYTYS